MRVRNIRGIEEEIEKAGGSQFIINPLEKKGKWKKLFGNDNPIFIEIGCGKGNFIKTLADRNKEINYIAIEKVAEILYKAILKIEGEDNLKIILADVKQLSDIFEENEIDGIYLNFSDPWPKNRHHKRRLTSNIFLIQYEKVLKRDGCIFLKTDNPILFEYSLNTLAAGWQLRNISLDYHPSEGIMDAPTEYEEKFRKKGNPIYRLEAVNKKTGVCNG